MSKFSIFVALLSGVLTLLWGCEAGTVARSGQLGAFINGSPPGDRGPPRRQSVDRSRGRSPGRKAKLIVENDGRIPSLCLDTQGDEALEGICNDLRKSTARSSGSNGRRDRGGEESSDSGDVKRGRTALQRSPAIKQAANLDVGSILQNLDLDKILSGLGLGASAGKLLG